MTMTHSAWLNALIIIGFAGTAAAAIHHYVGKPIAHAWLKVDRFLNTWNGEPERDGLPARPGLVDRVIAIEYQVHNNGGGSMKDSVDEVKRTTGRIEAASKLAATKATKAAEMAEEAAQMATKTNDDLAAHVLQSQKLIEQGAQDKADITARQDAQDQTIAEQKHTISNLAEALPVVARSTPPEETP